MECEVGIVSDSSDRYLKSSHHEQVGWMDCDDAMCDANNRNKPSEVSELSGDGRVRIPGWPIKCPTRLLTVRIDTREQTPWVFDQTVRTTVATCRSGDYCLDIDPSLAGVERKSLSDFARCCGVDRERFFKQVANLKGSVEKPLIILEADYGMIEIGTGWRGRLTPEQVLGTLHVVQNIVPVMLCRSREEAARACHRHLRLALTARYKNCREFVRILQ